MAIDDSIIAYMKYMKKSVKPTRLNDLCILSGSANLSDKYRKITAKDEKKYFSEGWNSIDISLDMSTLTISFSNGTKVFHKWELLTHDYLIYLFNTYTTDAWRDHWLAFADAESGLWLE